MTSFKIDPKNLSVDYDFVRGLEYKALEDKLFDQLKTQHTKPTQEGWEAGYSDLLKEDRFQPKYLTDNDKKIYRYNNNFIQCEDTQLEKKYLKQLLYKIFSPIDDYLYSIMSNSKQIVEFGAGTGHNLIILSKTWIGKKYLGFDFSLSAVEIMKKHGLKSFFFNMYDPNYFWDLKDSVVLTVGAMEQLGDNFQLFADYLLNSKANLFVHIEPIIEFYNHKDSFDQLAIEYHKKRHYLGEYYSYLQEKKVNILHAERTYFGNIYNEGYSIVIWSNK